MSLRAPMRAVTVALVSAFVLATLLQPADARAISGLVYHVLKCHPSHRSADELSLLGDHSSYQRVDQCGPQFADPKFGIYNSGAAPNNAFEQSMYVAPPSTVLRRVCLQYRLRRDSHHRAEIFAYPGFDLLAAGGDGPDGWSGTQCFPLNHQALIVRLACTEPGGCPAGPNAHAYVRNLDIEIEDLSDPVITNFGGTLLAGGWVRGMASIGIGGSDTGAGMSAAVMQVNGVEAARATGDCGGWPLGWPYTTTLVPCPGPFPQLNATRDTAQPPFQNGPNTVRAVALDFPGNASSETRTVFVDNAKPNLAFTSAQDPDDPELIRAPVADAHSGVDAAQLYYRPMGGVSWLPLETQLEAGEARARIDSSSLPAGDYEFKAEAADVAGNVEQTTLRQNGTPMRLTFPLRFESQLESRLGSGGAQHQTVPYGTSSTVFGQLLDGSGQPLVDKEVLVTENFGDGALIRERPTYAITDAEGRFETKVPAGPSRSIAVRFAGTQKYRPAKELAGTLQVRSRASFDTSRDELKEGQRLVFAGKVAHHGARIPSGGKLIELQVRVKTGRWDTVREAFRTDGNGRYRLGYRFGRHYVSDALFRFRVKVQDEGDWPFKGSTSPQRKVIVHAR